MQIGIVAYLRNLAVRCNKIARSCSDARAHEALAAISAEPADKAEALEATFKVPKERFSPPTTCAPGLAGIERKKSLAKKYQAGFDFDGGEAERHAGAACH